MSDLNGVYVVDLSTNGSAEEAGIKKGDVIKSINGYSVNSVSALQAKVGEYRPGDQIDVSVLRDGKYLTKTVTLKNMEGNLKLISGDELNLKQQLGVKFTEPSSDELKTLKIDGGVKVGELHNGKLIKAGVKEGFIITAVDNQFVTTESQLLDILKNKKGGVLLHGVYPNGVESYYAFGI